MSPETLLATPTKQSAWSRWSDRALFSLASGFLFIAMLLCMSLLWDAFWNAPPVHIENMDVVPEVGLCPGDRFDVHYRINVTKPVFLYRYTSVMNKGLDYNLWKTQDSFTPMPQPKVTVYEENFPWQVPNIPPGEYQRVVTLRGYNTQEKPVYIPTPFTVKEGCDEWSEQDRGLEDGPNGFPVVGGDYGLLALDAGTASPDLNFWYLYNQFRRLILAEPEYNNLIESQSGRR